MKIGFIGTGNMASAIIKGIIEKEFIKAKNIYLFDVMTDKVTEFSKEIGANVCRSNDELIRSVDVVVLSVKPNIIEKILNETRELIIEKRPLLISIAAGTPIEKLSTFLRSKEEVSIVRVMPNVNAMIGKGAAVVCGNEFASKEQVSYVQNMFQSLGMAWILPEKDFLNFTALAGSSPAYAYLFIDSIARAGVKNGLPKDLATQIAAQAVLGSAAMILESAENPWTLIDRVSSPGGTTVAGLIALEDEGFISTVVKGIDATIIKDIELNSK
ncbi:pyrroline-5-carboxylate reductase [Lactococcus lactis subsp. lactis]|uniref:pyrroline-5-carboxylate reductase n=1 Tax=Lactococcus lactis TaxID=1358 RepID=UPI0021AEF9B3|nr:pyrroline-5-carboxylate reductase [Lactococcus lactis]MCT0055227.1 pyrroline-5-carboxylate reductase [Lactococcus lactis subsp. lactis]